MRKKQCPRSPRRFVAACSILAALLLLGAPIVRAQSGTIVGQVTDATTKQPISNSSVQIDGSRLGASTDQDGRYRIANVPAGSRTVVARRIGYNFQRQTVNVGADQSVTVNFALQAAAVSLDQIVVTGTAGDQERREIGNAVATISAVDELSKSEAPNVTALLNARVSGVSIAQNTGRLGGGPSIQIRGVSSIGLSNSPLIYVDGVRVSNVTGGGPSGAGFGSQNSAVAGRLNDIDPAQIESIQIIKGPAAATIYGTEAANGVVQIITKKGSGTKPQVTLQVQTGSIYFRDAENRLPTNYIRNAGGTVVPFNGIRYEDSLGTPIFKTGQSRQYNLGLSGGTGGVNYYLSTGYQNDLGIEPNNSQRQFNAHANLNMAVTPLVDVGTSLNFVQADNHLGADEGLSPMLGAILGHPLLFAKAGAEGFYPNVPPRFIQQLYDNSDGVNRFTGSVTVNHRPIGWFSQRLIAGIDYTGEDARALERFAPPDLAPFALATPAGRVTQILTSSTLATADYSGTAKINLNSRIQSSTSLGGQFYRTETSQSLLGGMNFPGPGVELVSATSTAIASAQTQVINTTIGGYAQQEFGLNNRFFLTGALRIDNNSAFGSQFKSITYPKLSASWVINEEPFWHVNFVNTLKLRGAYGESGRAPQAFTALRTFTPVQGPGGSNAFTAGSFGNSNLKPERGKETEIGFESMLLNRLNIDFTYYNKKTYDEIVAQPIAPSTGFSGNQFRNLGRVDNHGIEVQANLQVLSRKNLAWEITGNYTTAENKIVSLGGLPSLVTSVSQANIVGYPIASFFSRRVISATQDPTTGAVSNVLCDGGPGKAPVSCATAPFLQIGTPAPTHFGSIGNTVTLFGKIRLYALVDWRGGNIVYNANEANRCTGALGAGLCDVNYNPKNYSAARVAEANATVGLTQGAQDQYIQDASFVKLREVSATLTLPDRFARGFKHASFTLSARELGLWTNYRGPDPQVSSNNASSLGGIDQGLIPPLSRLTATLNLTF
ncbi:MAG: SusC/RagA family TonB-linked outer membrane protein [Gemmatimonadota bacterium]|nr:SusC/RagA family TonB-linked outer membrane protein [Gemmatimonadota bacterium]